MGNLPPVTVQPVAQSFEQQVARLQAAGYPLRLVTAVAESLYRDLKNQNRPRDDISLQQQKCAVIPYIHGVAHNLKKIGNKAGVRVVMSAPEKLSKLCSETCPVQKEKKCCKINHRNDYVQCAQTVVYRIPMSCGRAYVG